jgi:hypothetical protein
VCLVPDLILDGVAVLQYADGTTIHMKNSHKILKKLSTLSYFNVSLNSY